MRAEFFGPQGDTRWNQKRLESCCRRFQHHELDMRNRDAVLACLEELRPNALVHTAAQPSHDLAASRPFEDFDVNAVGTMNLLVAARRSVPDAPFLHMSTNKVYGDAPNEIPIRSLKHAGTTPGRKITAGLRKASASTNANIRSLALLRLREIY
jgi:CDP-paratose 2-epimerase